MTAALCHTVRGEENAAKRRVSCAYLESNRALYSVRRDLRRLAGYANPVPTFLLGAALRPALSSFPVPMTARRAHGDVLVTRRNPYT